MITDTESSTNIKSDNLVVKPKEFPTLEFTEYGWCQSLKPHFRYEKGFYKPKTKKEYDALKKYAK